MKSARVSYKALIAGIIMSAAIFTSSFDAFAEVSGKLEVTVENNKFENSGKIQATQKNIGGVGKQSAGQVIVSPTFTAIAEVELRNNKFENSGTISADQTVMGGLGVQKVGQLIIE